MEETAEWTNKCLCLLGCLTPPLQSIIDLKDLVMSPGFTRELDVVITLIRCTHNGDPEFRVQELHDHVALHLLTRPAEELGVRFYALLGDEGRFPIQ